MISAVEPGKQAPPTPCSSPHHCTPTPARRVKTHQPLPVSLCLPQSLYYLGSDDLSLRWLGFHAWLQVCFQVPAGLSSGRLCCTPSLPGSNLPPPQVCAGWGWGPRQCYYSICIYEAQTQSLRSLDAFTTLCIHNLFLLLFNQSRC